MHHRTQDNTSYTSRGALAGTRNSSLGPPHEGSIQQSITPLSERKEMVYLQIYGIGYMVKNHSDCERKPAASIWAILSD